MSHCMPGRRIAMLAARDEVAQFNRLFAVGSTVRYWKGAKEGRGQLGRTRSEAFVAWHNQTGAVFIEGVSGFVALSHVEAVKEGATA